VNKIALGGLLAMLVAGAWLIAAPFVVRYQPAGALWTGPARWTWRSARSWPPRASPASSSRWRAGCGNCTRVGPSRVP
jgi:hypothetical protein